MADLMSASALLRRYRVTLEGACASVSDALAAGDRIVLHQTGPVIDGLAWLTLAPRVLDGAAYLRLLLVARPGHGLGSRLLASAEDEARTSARHVFLLVTADNVGARRFYQRHGYRYVGDLPGLVWPDLVEALYHKSLRANQQRD